MNKYEMRAEAVLKKKEEYLQKREKKLNRAVTVLASAACVAVVLAVASVFRNLISPINVFVVPTDNPSATDGATEFTHEMTVAQGYNGRKIFIYAEQENYGEFRTCYVNEKDEQDPYDESNRFGVVNAEGEIVVPPQYYRAYAVGENRFVAERKNNGYTESALITSDGKVLFGFFKGYLIPVNYGSEVHVLIADVTGGNGVLIRTDGSRVYDFEFDSLDIAHTTGAAGYESEELVKGIYNDKYYLINYKGETVSVFDESPKIKKPLGNGMNLTAAYRHYSGNYKTLLFGACDDSGKEVVPCEYASLFFTGDRFIGRRGDEQGLGPADVAVIYDTEGNLVCESGSFHHISIDYGAETGIGVVLGEWDNELMVSIGGCWVIDKNGNKLSDEYDRIEKNPDGTYTAYYDKQSKTHLLDANGKIIG